MADVVTPLDMPADADLPPVIPADWTAQVVVTTTYTTDITKSGTTLTEERRALSLRPYRDIRVRLSGMTQEQTYKLWTWLLRRVRNRFPVPLYCDMAETTSSSSGTTINCPTANRRFFNGGRVLIYQPFGADVLQSTGDFAEYARIDSFTSSAITLKGPDSLSRTYPAGCIVIPVIDAEVSLGDAGGPLQLVTDGIGAADVEASEVLGPSALPQEASGTPSGFATYNSYPILDVDPDWASEQAVLLSHDGTSEQMGRTNYVWQQGPVHRVGHQLTFTSMDRAEIASLRRFFDSRIGRCKAFYLVSPHNLFTVTLRGSNYIDVSSTYLDSAALLEKPLLSIVKTDGTILTYIPASVSASGSGWRITFTGSIAAFDLADVSRVSLTHFVRFNSDSMEEAWTTDGTCVTSLSTVELVAEQTVVITDA